MIKDLSSDSSLPIKLAGVSVSLWCLKVSIAAIKSHDQKQLRDEKVYYIVYSTSQSNHQRKLAQELKSGTQELQLRPWTVAAYWFSLLGLISLLSHAMQDHLPRDVTAWVTGPPTSIINH